MRLDTDAAGIALSNDPGIAASGSSVYVTWADFRNGTPFGTDWEIYFSIPFGAQPYGSGKAGTGGFVPVLEGTDTLNLGSTYSLTVSQGLGGADGVFAFGFRGSKASVPFAGGTLLVDPFAVLVPFVLDGGSGTAGGGTAVLDLVIPVNISLLGVNLNAQAGIFDAGAEFGLSMSNGVEAWIL